MREKAAIESGKRERERRKIKMRKRKKRKIFSSVYGFFLFLCCCCYYSLFNEMLPLFVSSLHTLHSKLYNNTITSSQMCRQNLKLMDTLDANTTTSYIYRQVHILSLFCYEFSHRYCTKKSSLCQWYAVLHICVWSIVSISCTRHISIMFYSQRATDKLTISHWKKKVEIIPSTHTNEFSHIHTLPLSSSK